MMASILTLSGSWFREIILLNSNFYLISLGTIVCAIGQVFYINNASTLASAWFGDKEVNDLKMINTIFREA